MYLENVIDVFYNIYDNSYFCKINGTLINNCQIEAVFKVNSSQKHHVF